MTNTDQFIEDFTQSYHDGTGTFSGNGLLGGINNLWNNFTGKTADENADNNFGLQQEEFEYKKNLQERMFSREDNAVRRRAHDMEASGLSRTLAAGGAAKAGAPINITAPQKSSEGLMKKSLVMPNVLNLMRQKADISLTNSQKEVSNAQKNKINTETEFMKNNNPNIVVQNEIKAKIMKFTNHQKIKQAQADLSNTLIRNRLNQENIDIAIQNRIKAELDVDLKNRDLLAKILAYNIKKKDSELYYQLGLPTTTNMDAYYKYASTGLQALRGITDK